MRSTRFGAGLATLLFIVHAAAGEEPMRTWTSQSGAKLEAGLVRIDGPRVVLKSADGRQFQVLATQLSAEDQSYLKEQGVSPVAAGADPAPLPSVPPPPPAGDLKPEWAPGETHGPVACKADEQFHYFVYVPASLAPGEPAWSVMFVMSPGGGNAGGLKRYRAGAELNGVVLALSQESRNNSENAGNAVRAMIEDVFKRLPRADPAFTFASGFSGGSRMSFLTAASPRRRSERGSGWNRGLRPDTIPPMPRNEQQTRFELIDPALFARGWQRGDIAVEETACAVDIVDGKGRPRPAGRTDYVLRRPLPPGTEPFPLAILEAKHEGLPPEHGLQQGMGYRLGALHDVPFVISSNGHQFVMHDITSGQTDEPKPMSGFPSPDDLVARALKARGLTPELPGMSFFATPYARGRQHLRYYQDAAIRAAVRRILRNRTGGAPPRALLSLATGSGKTRIAAALLRRLFDAGLMGRALFVCDRTELRDNGLGDFQDAFGTDAAEVDTLNPQKNARVLIATYQTLDDDRGGKDDAFFLRHYPPGFFDAIVIDECHRSAWGQWHAVLERYPAAIQIGLTATPRQIRLPETPDREVLDKVEEERRLLADNFRYFGDPAYEYPYLQGVADGYLAPAEIETYDLFHDGRETPERIRGVHRADLEGRRIEDLATGHAVPLASIPQVNEGGSLEARLVLPARVEAMCEHLFARLLHIGEGDPLQKTIVFCASDHHADLVAIQLNNLYHRWCREEGHRRISTYAFKCMASSNGQALIPEFRGRQRSHMVATTKDLLTTGVNVPAVRAVVFFRYLQSPILFHQMVGRGTRIDARTGKLMFRILDYTGATALFGRDFVTPPPTAGGDTPPGPVPPKARAKGGTVEVQDSGTFNLIGRDGRMVRATPAEYRQRLVEDLLATVPALADFRARWMDAESRRELLRGLAEQGLLPEKVRESEGMADYDLFDVIAAAAYGIRPRSRSERAAQAAGPDWIVRLPQPTAKVIRAILRQFERAGTEALETGELWNTPEIRDLKGLDALCQGGDPGELMRKLKDTIFAA